MYKVIVTAGQSDFISIEINPTCHEGFYPSALLQSSKRKIMNLCKAVRRRFSSKIEE